MGFHFSISVILFHFPVYCHFLVRVRFYSPALHIIFSFALCFSLTFIFLIQFNSVHFLVSFTFSIIFIFLLLTLTLNFTLTQYLILNLTLEMTLILNSTLTL